MEYSLIYITGGEFTDSGIERAVRETVGQGASVLAEVFQGADCALVFVSRAIRRAFYVFAGPTELAAAVRGLEPVTSELWRYRGEYIFSAALSRDLSEFGQRIDPPPFYAEFLDEHGVRLFHGDAIAGIKRYF